MPEFHLGRMTAADPPLLAELHARAFPNFFLASLGPRFLTEFYSGFLDDPTAISVVARDGSGRPVGAAVGTSEPAGFYRRLLKRRFWGLAIASGVVSARRPSAMLRLARGALYRGGVGDGAAPPGALLSSICTEPKARGTGLGRRILAEWEQEARGLGAPTAHLSTDAHGNDATNAFYHSTGWTLDHEYVTREGRGMNLYRKDLAR